MSSGRMAYQPKSGFAWNQLRDFPRNEPCFCGSKVKFKKCHGDRLKPCVSAEAAKKIKRFFDLRARGIMARLVLNDHADDKNAQEAQLEEVPETQQKSLKDDQK